jgi:hypothetical protein
VDAKVKGFVRMALAMEHRRMPIKREDLTKKGTISIKIINFPSSI